MQARSRFKRSVSIFAAAFLALGLLPRLRAQQQEPPKPPNLTELTPEDLAKVEVDTVSGASKFDQKINEAPASVTIITADEFRKYGYRTLDEALRSVRGFYVANDRSFEYIGLRGFSPPGDYNTRMLILIDGHRVNESLLGAAFGDRFAVLDVDLIERVEIIRGPSSSLYGASAFFGVINIITKRGRMVKGWEVSAEGGSLGTYKSRLTYGNRFRSGRELLLSGDFYDSFGHQRLYYSEYDSPQTNNGWAVDVDRTRYLNVFGDYSFQDFRLQGAFAATRKVIPTGANGVRFDDGGNRTIGSEGYLNLGYQHRFSTSWQFAGHLYFDHSSVDGNYVFDFSQPGVPLLLVSKLANRGEQWGLDANVSRTLAAKHHVTLGAEFRDSFRQVLYNYSDAPPLVYLDDHRTSFLGAFYVQDEFRVRNGLILQAGLRYDCYSSFGGTLNPRVGLIYTPWERTTFKLLYGQAFRAPTPFELHFSGGAYTANPALQPEKMRASELVFEQKLSERLQFSASAYYNRIGNLISRQLDPADLTLQYQNLDHVVGRGMELELGGRWESGLQTRLSYSFQDTDSLVFDKDLTNSPKQMAKANLILPLIRRKLFAGLEGQYMSSRGTLHGTSLPGFFLMNATLFCQKLAPGLELSASVYNLFNKQYSDPAGSELRQDSVLQDGRTLRIKLTYRFHRH